MPVLTVFAAPNGAGKSSMIPLVDFEGRENLVEVDEIARRINPKHRVPDEDVRRRYARSLSNASQIMKTVDHASAFDNSREEPRLAFEMRSGVVLTKAVELPPWAAKLLEDVDVA